MEFDTVYAGVCLVGKSFSLNIKRLEWKSLV